MLFAISLVGAFASPSRASSELCGDEWTLEMASYDECRNAVALSPGNDTRVNLLLLLNRKAALPPAAAPAAGPVLAWRDFAGQFSSGKEEDPAFTAGEGSLCRSNASGAAAFAAAVKAAALPARERDALLGAREGIDGFCSGRGGEPGKLADELIGAMSTTLGKDFTTYLRGAAAFYAGRLNDAADDFALARRSSDCWLADAADYMVARTEVNRMQAGAFDAYGTFRGSEAVDREAAAAAETSLENYLKVHPGGRYGRSARGLQRRVAWLAGWTERLAALYAALLSAPDRDLDDISLAAEIDSKLLPKLTPAMTRDPTLLAVLDLKAMRRPAGAKDEAWRATAVSPSDLDGQRDAFAGALPLHEFLQAARAFYVEGAAEPAMRLLPDDTRRRDGDAVWFSRQMLRGRALEAKGDRNARGFWKELHPGANRPLQAATIELALALHDDAHGTLDDVFAPGSPVNNPEMRGLLLQYTAGPALLRRLAHDAAAPPREARLASVVLLQKELTHAFYDDFLVDLAATAASTAETPGGIARPSGVYATGDSAGEIGCPVLPTTVRHLATDPDSPRDRLCLAEFERLNAIGQAYETQPPAGSLGSGTPQFPRRALTRTAIYRAVIADRDAAAAERSYALYRAVRCYEPSGVNECGGPAVPKATRRGWYNELKRSYPASSWAKELHYWW